MAKATEAQTTEETPDEETPEPIEGDDADLEEEEHEEQTPAEAAAEEGGATLQAAIEDAAHAHAGKLRKIYGDRLPDFLCPLCEGYGIVDPGTEALDLLAWDETSTECPTCKGYARVRKHTKDQEHMVAPCMSCGATGWITQSAPAPNVYQMPQTSTAPAAPPAPPQYGYMDANGVFQPFASPGTG